MKTQSDKRDLAVASSGEQTNTTSTPRLPVPDVCDADMAFGGDEKVLPKFSTLPEEFQRERSPYCRIAQTLFFSGGTLSDFGLTPKEGVDAKKAMRAIRCCLGSFRPKHEHKIAGVGFMFSQWFDLSEKVRKQ